MMYGLREYVAVYAVVIVLVVCTMTADGWRDWQSMVIHLSKVLDRSRAHRDELQ